MTNSEKALELIQDGQTVGLGSGRASTEFIRALGDRVGKGLRVRGVPTSETSAKLARELGIPLVSLQDGMPIDVTVDGADEVDPDLNLIKGYGRALVREKIVAAASKKFVILIGPEKVGEKLVARLGERKKLPVEVVPFGLPLARLRLEALGCRPEVYETEGRLFVTDNGNNILDCAIGPLADPAGFERSVLAIPGVVDTGLFIGMADLVLIQDGERLDIKERK